MRPGTARLLISAGKQAIRLARYTRRRQRSPKALGKVIAALHVLRR